MKFLLIICISTIVSAVSYAVAIASDGIFSLAIMALLPVVINFIDSNNIILSSVISSFCLTITTIAINEIDIFSIYSHNLGYYSRREAVIGFFLYFMYTYFVMMLAKIFVRVVIGLYRCVNK